MFPIKKFLAKFGNFTNTEKVKKDLILEVFRGYGINIEWKQVSFSRNTLFLRIPPIVKTEILIHREKILETMGSVPELKHIKEII